MKLRKVLALLLLSILGLGLPILGLSVLAHADWHFLPQTAAAPEREQPEPPAAVPVAPRVSHLRELPLFGGHEPDLTVASVRRPEARSSASTGSSPGIDLRRCAYPWSSVRRLQHTAGIRASYVSDSALHEAPAAALAFQGGGRERLSDPGHDLHAHLQVGAAEPAADDEREEKEEGR